MSSLVTFGETMLRLSPPSGTRLSRVDQLDVNVGGAESNVAVAAAALGADAAWLSVLPDTALGERIAHALRGESVDPLVTWGEGRVGTYYYEPGGRPRGQTVVYDRRHTPLREATPGDFDFQHIRAADVFFTSGITPALSDRAARTTASLLQTAAESGVQTALDVNYRSKLWSPASARETLTDLFEVVDTLFVAARDARTVLDIDGDAVSIAQSLLEAHDFEEVVVTRGDAGAVALSKGTVTEQEAFETDTLDPVGSGDAFVGGYLARRLAGGDVQSALAYGAGTAALARTLAGDMATVSRDEVATIVAGADTDTIDR